MSFRPNILHVLFFQGADLSVRAPVVSCKLAFASSWLILPVNLVFQDLEDQIQEETGKVNHLNKVKAKLEQEIDEVGLSQSRNLYVTSQIVSWKFLSIVCSVERRYLNLSFPRFLPVLALPRFLALNIHIFYCIAISGNGSLGTWKESSRWCWESEEENRGRSQGEEKEGRIGAVWPFQWGYDIDCSHDRWVKTVNLEGILLTYPLLVLVDHNKA